MGYEHFTVTHKTTFKQQIYKYVDTGEIVQCNTIRIEGAWKISKDHFRKINGTNTKLFEQHLFKVIWRNHVHRSNVYERFFDLMKSVYTLGADAIYEHTKPLFGTWTPPSAADVIQSYRIQMRTLPPMKRLLLPLQQVCLLGPRQRMLAELYCFGLSIRLAVPQYLRLLLCSL